MNYNSETAERPERRFTRGKDEAYTKRQPAVQLFKGLCSEIQKMQEQLIF